MPGLLESVTAAHGGWDRWRAVRWLGASASVGGLLLTAKGHSGALDRVQVFVKTDAPFALFMPFLQPGLVGVFQPHRVAIRRADGPVVLDRRHPRAAMRSLRRQFRWDALDLLYFAGYAFWHYLCTPFVLGMPGVASRELSSRSAPEQAERTLDVEFPPWLPAHAQHQRFFFDREGMLRRCDYTAEPVGPWARAAHFCAEPRRFSGLVFPTRRWVVPRWLGNRALPGPVLVSIRIANVDPMDGPPPALGRLDG